MSSHTRIKTGLLGLGLLLAGCTAAVPPIPVDHRSVQPGTSVTLGGSSTYPLLGKPLRVGDRLPSATLVDTHLQPVDLDSLRGRVLVLSIVPSLDTRVCERQTHLLGEAGRTLPGDIRLVTISRDLPFAQQRFADDTGFRDILYLSDYRNGEFGLATGLLVDEIRLLARAMMVVDRAGTVRYLQIVPELSHLPDMETALNEARRLEGQ